MDGETFWALMFCVYIIATTAYYCSKLIFTGR
jgi:hypothetical protein